jgi:hypothetical protein
MPRWNTPAKPALESKSVEENRLIPLSGERSRSVATEDDSTRAEDTPLLSASFSAADCPACYRCLVVSFHDARPAGELIQEIYACDVDDLCRFFGRDEWLRNFDLPLVLTWGTAAEWRAIAAVWRETRARKEGEERFLSLEEIEVGGKDSER